MPRRWADDDEEPTLFDLPLEAPAPEQGGGRRERPAPPAPPPPPATSALPLFTVERRADHVPRPPATPAEPPPDDSAASRRERLLAGLADLLVHAAIAVTAAVGAILLGVHPEPTDWPPFALFLLTFSFLYSVVPLAFWGQTLGMAWAGLHAVNTGGQPLSFAQTALRWLGALLTAAALGLPLLAAGRRSLADAMSGSVTLRRR